MPSIFRNPTTITFIDEDNPELAHLTDTESRAPGGGERPAGGVPYVVERVGYDIPDKSVERIWVVCRRA